MEILRIRGGAPLRGSVPVSGAKNAALPILFAAILSEETSSLQNVPDLADIKTTLKVLDTLGIRTRREGGSVAIDGRELQTVEAPYELVRTMRASVLVLGPLLARKGEARVSLPGGCAIGARPVDFHLKALEALGARFEIERGYIHGKASQGLRGGLMVLPFPSVGATENALMAAVLAQGDSEIQNAACEPEITDLACALRSMGARITGEGTPQIRIQGVARLHGMNHAVAPDRVEAATFLCAGPMSGGKVRVTGIDPAFLGSAIETLRKMGVSVSSGTDWVESGAGHDLSPTSIRTEPFPGFPTDMQAQFMALMTRARGTSHIEETIFENRFMHVPELVRLGAKIRIQGHEAWVEGPTRLSGATVMATDLRASASLVLAGLAATGETVIRRIYHLDRGYEKLEQKLGALGADIRREIEK
jgi:UDP-N-acetylglucosamine 1-carboxyvinyltransferase